MGRFARVLLVYPYYRKSILGAHRPSPGLGYLSEYLLSRGIDNWVYDMMIPGNRSYASLKKVMRRLSPDLVGISLTSYRYLDHYALIARIRSDFPDVGIVAGGPHISTFVTEALTDCPGIDFGVCGEGEYALAELCEGREPGSIEGLAYREGGEIVRTSPRPFEKRPEIFPFPRYGKFEMKRYSSPEIPIISSRGCPYSCTFCSVRSCLGSVFRGRSAGDVVDELEYWRGRGVRRFDFADDNFTLDKKRVYMICGEIERRGLAGLELYCNNGVRADRLDRDVLLAMKRAGFKGFAIGVESGSEKVLALVRKGETVSQLEQAVALSCELGFEVGLFFVIGLPGDTLGETRKSLDFARRYPIGYAHFWNFFPYPKTEAYEWVKIHGTILNPETYLNTGTGSKWSPFFHTPDFSLSDRKKAIASGRKVSVDLRRRAWEDRLRRLPSVVRLCAVYAMLAVERSNTAVWVIARVKDAIAPWGIHLDSLLSGKDRAGGGSRFPE